MALKDWKKILTSKNNNTWMNKINKRLVKVDKTKFEEKHKQWVIYGDAFYKVEDSVKYFGTKTQAFKYAKNYMRKH